MALFLGGMKNTTAARCALKINYAVAHIINPALANQYAGTQYRVKQVVGIDTSQSWRQGRVLGITTTRVGRAGSQSRRQTYRAAFGVSDMDHWRSI